MTKSKFEDKELGNKFIEMGNKFLTYAQENKTVLDFEFCSVQKNLECGTVACHSGHACVIFGLKRDSDFTDGARAIAKFLGFRLETLYVKWAEENPELWGNEYGGEMFFHNGYKSFGTLIGKCTLTDIGNWYINVGGRLIVEKLNT